jgi:hypothetical protein
LLIFFSSTLIHQTHILTRTHILTPLPPHTCTVTGTVAGRLETCIVEAAADHFRNLSRRARRLIDTKFDRPAHVHPHALLLSARHLFKLGYYHETMRDDEGAVKYESPALD